MFLKYILMFLSITSIVTAQEYYHLKPVKVADSTYCVYGDINGPDEKNLGFSSNVCYINLGNEILLMDAGPTYQFAKELDNVIQKQFHLPVKYVVLTNYHDDRIQGASYFAKKDVQIIGHKTLNEDINKNPQKYERIVRVVPKKIYENTTVPKATKSFSDKLIITGSKYNVEIIKPSKVSQSPSDIIVYVPKHKLLFVGNIIFNVRMINYAKDSNMEGWLKAFKIIKKLNPKIIIGGHGKDISATSYETTEKYLLSMKAQVDKEFDDGTELEDIVHKVNLNSFKSLKHFDSLNGKNIYNYFIQLEWAEG